MGANAPTISVDDAAQLLEMSRDTIYKSIASGEIRAVKLCRRYRITKREVNRLLGYSYFESFPYEEASSAVHRPPLAGLAELTGNEGE